MKSKNTFGGKVAEARSLVSPRLGETMNETEHQKLIAKLKASCVATHLAFIDAELTDHAARQAADDDYIKAKSAYEKALAVEGNKPI